jgi:hypothetical protein
MHAISTAITCPLPPDLVAVLSQRTLAREADINRRIPVFTPSPIPHLPEKTTPQLSAPHRSKAQLLAPLQLMSFHDPADSPLSRMPIPYPLPEPLGRTGRTNCLESADGRRDHRGPAETLIERAVVRFSPALSSVGRFSPALSSVRRSRTLSPVGGSHAEGGLDRFPSPRACSHHLLERRSIGQWSVVDVVSQEFAHLT